eukprot:CAMPEP_0167752024 /NCGR_PEP_ID=MMETSP0110_2-20121227/6903_1 /TAXON_ID=629695 /ORGANISM="Gymnochlora sp., Strain CCMP2014" /LENGTH=462 /DNA_ID=CAMNT_0007637583 /DNA_START=1134 /DNA_END=2522 /DNA_ORIENTATION=+
MSFGETLHRPALRTSERDRRCSQRANLQMSSILGIVLISVCALFIPNSSKRRLGYSPEPVVEGASRWSSERRTLPEHMLQRRGHKGFRPIFDSFTSAVGGGISGRPAYESTRDATRTGKAFAKAGGASGDAVSNKSTSRTTRGRPEFFDKKSGMEAEAAEPSISDLQKDLCNPKCPIGKRMDTVFSLKNIGGKKAIDALSAGLVSDSVLLNHEICYVFGQMRDPYALPVLYKVLADDKEDAVVRHEAAEAMGAIGLEESVEMLRKYSKSSVKEVAETCELALDTIAFKLKNGKTREDFKDSKGKEKDVCSGKYFSVDPAPPSSEKKKEKEYGDILVDDTKSLFIRYRAMFALRDTGTKEAVKELARAFADKSAIVKHEIAYVMGQMRMSESIPFLETVLKDEKEHAMVRHEAAEALGSISTTESVKILEGFKNDKARIVSESCKVALDIADDWTHMNSSTVA